LNLLFLQRNIGKLFFILLFTGMLVGCSEESQKSEKAFAIAIRDFRGETVSLDKPARRVVCLIESALSGIYMLGQQSKLVGIPGDAYHSNTWEKYAGWDARIRNKSLPAPGNWDFVSIEQVVGLAPDLVIIWASQTEAIEIFEGFGIPVYGVMLQNFENVYKELKDFGEMLDCSARAEYLVDFTMKELEKARLNGPDEKKKTVYFMWAQGINETAGINSTVNQLLESAGTINACKLPDEHVTINIEKLIDWDPDIIVMWYNEKLDPQDVIDNPLLQGLKAVRNNEVFEFPSAFDCDLWTVKFVYPVQLISQWAYGEDKNIEVSGPEALQRVFYDQKSLAHE